MKLIDMKRILFLFSMLFCITSVYAQKDCEGGNNDRDPNPPHQQDPLDGTETSGGISADPNEIIGPMGYDSVHWVSINDILNYTILFENDPEFATANAQKVDVRFKFEDKAQMRGFGLGMYGFANMSWPIDDNPAAYQNRLDLRDSMYIYVDLVAGIDVVKQEAFWTFNSIDPETGLNPWQVDRGMLPVNDSTHIGEGFLKFQLKPNPNMVTGDTISFAANIVFDQNDTIPTNRWCVTIDAGMPTSKVKGKQDSKNENLYHLTFQAADDKGGSGLKRVVLYQANNFGIYEEFAVCPLDTVIDFMAEPGKQYSFYTLAEDNVGNVEPLKDAADLVININAAPTNITLSDTVFQDDILPQGFIAELTSEDVDGTKFTYELAEGDGAVHNDLFLVKGSQLVAKNTFKCAEENEYKIRISSTDDGSISFSKAFTLTLKNVLEKPVPDTLAVTICEGDAYEFKGAYYEESGTYLHTVSNDYMCDSVYVLQLTVLPRLAAPVVTVEGECTLVSSAAKGNQWFTIDGDQVEGANEQKFTPTEEGIYYVCASNGACFSEPSNAYQVKLSADIDLSMELKKGWNWISSNLSDDKWQEALQFLAPIIDNVDKLISKHTLSYDDASYGTVGDISTLEATEAYKLRMDSTRYNVWQGVAFSPKQKTIALAKGWNWIGYIPIAALPVDEALANIVPAENDVVKNLEEFAIYSNGRWVGTLTEMKPGEGYLYYSGNETMLAYPAGNAFVVSKYSSKAKPAMVYAMPWNVNTNTYPDNMNIVADVYANGNVVPEGLFTIGAFIDDECVGVGKYIDGKLFLTVNGSEKSNQNVTLKAYDNNSNKVCDIVESFSFVNAIYGNVNKPYNLTISESTGIEDISTSEYNIFPKPIRNRMYINGPTEEITSIAMVTMNGVRVINEASYNTTGIDVSSLKPGTYAVMITTANATYVDKIIKVHY
jgi:hypothetical protein